MKRLYKRLLILTILSSQCIISQSKNIIIDGVFDEWTPELEIYTDTSENIEGIDLLEFQVTNNDEFIFLKIKTNNEFDLTGDTPFFHDLFLYFDTDRNSETGFAVRDDFGSELSIDLASRILYNNFENTPSPQIKFSDINFRAAPTVTANEFEIAIRRDVIPDGVNPIFPNNQINIMFRNQANYDWLPNLNSIYTYTFSNDTAENHTPIAFEKNDPNFIRVMAYNTKLDALLDQNKLEEYERIIKAIKPDIVGFIEGGNTSANYVKGLFDNWLPIESGQGWQVKKHGGEITVSRWQIIEEWDLERQFPVLIDLPESYGTDLLYTNAHLSCCGNDEGRQRQADQYAAFILDAKSQGGIITLTENTPIIYSGDLNLVGLAQQLSTLVNGDIIDTDSYGEGGALDWDNSSLKDENILQSDIPMNYTWRDDNSSFPPGKLDFMIYSDFSLKSEKSFILQTEVMSDNRLTLYNLEKFDTSIASDHFPVISDFSIKENATLSISENTIFSKTAYPNPAKNNIYITLNTSDIYTYSIYNNIGLNILTGTLSSSSNNINIESLRDGLYYIVIKNDKNETNTFKIIKNNSY